MATKFSDFMKEVEREAADEGPEATAELAYFRARFTLARRFAEARQRAGWTQKVLAAKTGIDQSEISVLESGEANPTFKTMYLLATALGARIDFVKPSAPRGLAGRKAARAVAGFIQEPAKAKLEVVKVRKTISQPRRSATRSVGARTQKQGH